jgi:two-component system response regulator YesN
MGYLMQLKVKNAKQLLREEDCSVMEISDRLGFESANYFTKVFKHYTGETPSAYKKHTKF